MKGTSLFGWCLPGMGIAQHKECARVISDGTLECPCLCHTDFDTFAKQLATPKRRKGKGK
jgi:hypothetical protein